MKTKILAVITVGLALLCAWQWQQLRAAKTQLADTERALQGEAQAREEQEAKTLALEQQRSRLNGEVANLSELVAAFRATEAKYATNLASQTKPTPAGSGTEAKDSSTEQGGGLFGKGMSGMLSNMMKDPAMKEMMRAQQKLVMGTMYGGMAKDLNLTPEQNEKLTELLLEKQMKSIDHAQSWFTNDGKMPATTLVTAIGDEEKQSDEGIKALLGEDKFGQYQEYKKTLGERIQINTFKQQLDGGPSPLQDDQVKQLMSAIREERDKAPPAVSDDVMKDPANLQKVLSGDLVEKQMQWQEQMNQKVLERAAQILTPEQVKAYGEFQSQQLNMQKLGMRMAREMFGNKEGASDATSPVEPAK